MSTAVPGTTLDAAEGDDGDDGDDGDEEDEAEEDDEVGDGTDVGVDAGWATSAAPVEGW
nr:hypothetical protein [Streptomyces sp. IMTB 2501]